MTSLLCAHCLRGLEHAFVLLIWQKKHDKWQNWHGASTAFDQALWDTCGFRSSVVFPIIENIFYLPPLSIQCCLADRTPNHTPKQDAETQHWNILNSP
jgi:hypothetical protein